MFFSSTTWIIVSWVLVAIFTAVNVVVFMKLKSASEQMMKMAFPGAKNMQEAMTQMQSMMGPGGMGAMSGMRPGSGAPASRIAKSFGKSPGAGKAPQSEAQLKAAMEMLKNMQGPAKGK